MNLDIEAIAQAYETANAGAMDPHALRVFCYTCKDDVDPSQCGHFTLCPDCRKIYQIGDFPLCPHGAPQWRDAKNFDPVLAWEYPDGTIGSTGSNDEKIIPMEGARPIMITTLRQADALVRRVNAQEQEQMDMRTEQKRHHHDRAQRESRQQLRAELEKRSISAANVDAILADRDGRGPGKDAIMQQFEQVARASGAPFNREAAERMYDQTQRSRRNPDYRGRPQSNFQIEVFAQDASNRHGQRDAATGWRERGK